MSLVIGRWLIVGLALGGALPRGARAQEPFGRMGPIAARGGIVLGVQGLSVDDLNTQLRAQGYPDVPATAFTLGGRALLQRGRWLLGGEGSAVVTPRKSSANGAQEAQLMGGIGLVELGVALLQHRRWIVYPMVGIGGGGLGVDLQRGRPATFGQVLAAPTGSRPMRGIFAADLSLGVDHLVLLRRTPERRGGIFFGLRAGYTLTSNVGDWRLAGDDLGGGPSFGLNRPYLRFTFGGWGARERRFDERGPMRR